MTRRSNTNGHKYEYDKAGAFGCFRSINTEPVEYLLTTFSIDEFSRLSYARDLQTELNFEYLIQRDIDEERALAEISQYISAETGRKQNEVVFLPPLLVAIVGADDNNNIQSHYPACIFKEESDQHGKLFVREWPGLFKVENYGVQGGLKHKISCVEEEVHPTIDTEQAKIYLNLAPKDSSGAKLVVIDGQHRLFALNYLRQHETSKIEGLTIPVCIVYPPNSTNFHSGNSSFLKVPDVLRSLFVDVNSTVERVSGHFLTLLSDQTLGSLICRDFCKTVLSSLGPETLGLVEWNTKNHKQSLEISREHTITSIGVINGALEENFKTKNGVKLLTEILNLESSSNDFDFDDEYEERSGLPDGFPWRGFSVKHKEKLGELVEENVTPYLIELFFSSKPYSEARDIFVKMLADKEAALRAERSPDCNFFSCVKAHLLFNDPIKKDDKSSVRLLSEFLTDYKDARDQFLPPLFRKSILQKSIIDTWVFLLQKLLPRNVEVRDITKITTCLVDHASNKNVDLFNLSNVYLQDTIYTGTRIKVTKSAKKQLSRLLIAQLGNDKLCRDVLAQSNLGEELSSVLRNIAEVEVGGYYSSMLSDKRKQFEKSYKTNFSIAAVDRERLILAESKRNEKISLSNDVSSSIKIEEDFSALVESHLEEDFRCAADNLIQNLKFEEFILYTSEDTDED